MTEVHTYSAGEEGLLVNAYLVEPIGASWPSTGR